MRKLVVIIDMQNDFITGSLGSKEAESIVPTVIETLEKYKKENATIIATKDFHTDNYFETLEGNRLPVKHCIVGTEGYELHPDIEKCLRGYDNFHSFIKQAFGFDWWSIRYHFSNFCDEIIIFGLCTDICVISNALILHALYPNVPITCLESCCAGSTPEAHKMALNVMQNCLIDIK